MPVTSSTYHRLDPRKRVHLLAAAALAAFAIAVSGAAQAQAGPTTLLIEGAGEGHGVGMSQDGALGYAQHGESYQAILTHYYTGTTLGSAPAGARVRVLIGSKVVELPLERYVRGVLAAEMPASWPLAALEAQAVASRTYALTAHAGGARFDVYSDTRSQVYRGKVAETPQTNAAIAATAGQIVLYAGQPAITYFFASSGGMTENVSAAWPGAEPEPWLTAVADPYDAGPSSRWHKSIGFAAAATHLTGLVKGSFRGIEVLSRGASPRIVAALVLGSGGSTQVSGPDLAARLGLPATWAYFSVQQGARVVPEPDSSGHAPAASPAPATPAAPATGTGGTMPGA